MSQQTSRLTNKMIYTLPAVLYFVGMIILAHFFAPPGYAWTENTISELGSQGHAYKGIMQVGFIGFGIFLVGGLLFKARSLGRVNLPDLLVSLYGLAILMTGFYCAAPIDISLSYSVSEAQTHSFFATLAGFFLVAGMMGYLLVSPSRGWFHLAFIVLIAVISGLFGLSENGMLLLEKGIIQRVLYLVAFAWLWVSQQLPAGEMG